MQRDIVLKSLQMDLFLSRAQCLSPMFKARFLQQKIRALVMLAQGKDFRFDIDSWSVEGTTISELGTLQSCIIDVGDELITTGVGRGVTRALDIGANIGQWSAAFRVFNPTAQITCIEADPRVYHRLKQNAALLGGIRCISAAAGRSDRWLTFYRHPLPLMSSLVPPTRREDITETVEVHARPLDDLALGDFELVKIDVEGAELDVLHGASELLARAEYLAVELSLDRPGASALEVLEFVRRVCPRTRVIAFGRPLGPRGRPVCQDVVLRLH